MPARNKRDGIIVISDGTPGTAEQLVITHEKGDLAWSEKEEAKTVLDRGVLDSQRSGDEAPCDLSFSTNHVELCATGPESEADTPTLYEIMHKIGAASDWASTSPVGEKHTVTVTFWVLNPDANGLDEKIVFARVSMTSLDFKEGDDANSLDLKAIDFETRPTITRAAYTG
jgi:hypothetical protein